MLFDLLNAALRREATRFHRTRALRAKGLRASGSGGGGAEMLPTGAWRVMPESEEELQRMVEAACQQAVAWLVAAQQSELLPVEVILSCTLAADTLEIEKAWSDVTRYKEDIIADVSDTILRQLVSEVSADIERRETGLPRPDP